jgi:hypothetical protein
MFTLNWIESNFVILTSLAAAIKWIWEYSSLRKFEKNKFLLERIEKFLELESTQKVHKLLDWNSIHIEIHSQPHIINDQILNEALLTHDQKHRFDPHEIYLREIFDEYFDNLGKLIILSETGLVDKQNLKKFLRYWIMILSGKSNNKPQNLILTFHKYLEFYGYLDVLKFLK